MGKTHKLGGLCCGLIASSMIMQLPYTKEKLLLSGVLIGMSVFGSLFPDIDHTNSMIGKEHKAISRLTNILFGHRGITHAPLFNFIIVALLLYLTRFLTGRIQIIAITGIFGLFIGLMSHLILDIITVSGIPVFYPFSKRCIHIARLKSSKHNGVISILLICITALIVIIQLVF